MSSPRQIEANRRNSQFSTGPRTPEGKAVSRFNALKSGINAQAQVIPGEDPADLEAMAAGYHQEWAPTTWLERFLVDSLVRADWLLQRLSRLEAQLWAVAEVSAESTEAPLGEAYTSALDRFTRLQRRIDSTERSYYRALTQLQRLRANAQPEVTPAEELASFCPPTSGQSEHHQLVGGGDRDVLLPVLPLVGHGHGIGHPVQLTCP